MSAIRCAVWGAGAIGGVVGAGMARAGEDVLLVDVFPEHVKAMDDSGLVIRMAGEDERVQVRAALPTAVDGIRFDIGDDFLRRNIPSAYRDAYEMGGERAESVLTLAGIAARFDLLNPRSVDYVRRESGRLITQWGESSQSALRALMERAFVDGIPPRRLASLIIDSGIGLTTRDALAVERFRTRLEDSPDNDYTQDRVDTLAERYADRLLRGRDIGLGEPVGGEPRVEGALRGRRGRRPQDRIDPGGIGEPELLRMPSRVPEREAFISCGEAEKRELIPPPFRPSPIGLRTILAEARGGHGRGIDAAMLAFGAVLLALGLRAVYAVTAGAAG